LWTIGEERGDVTPHGLQHMLSRASWDEDAVAGDVRDYVTTAFADPDAVLVLDETGDVKKGVATVGVQRQCFGTAGRIENSQVAVYLTYAAVRGHALIDGALYLPKSWTEDPSRRVRAGVPDDIEFATKPVLAQRMIVDALVAGMPTFGWQPLSAGPGSKGPRLYSWLLINIASTLPGSEWIMMRCNDSTHELAYYRCSSPHPRPLRTARQDARRDQRGHPVGHRHHSTRSGRGWPWVGRVRRLLPRERQLAALCKHRHGE